MLTYVVVNKLDFMKKIKKGGIELTDFANKSTHLYRIYILITLIA